MGQRGSRNDKETLVQKKTLAPISRRQRRF